MPVQVGVEVGLGAEPPEEICWHDLAHVSLLLRGVDLLVAVH